MPKNFQDRYLRNQNTLTAIDQKRLYNSRVAIVGLGGLGGGVAEMLARMGVGSLDLLDGDVFEVSNLNRQLFSTEKNMGMPKARAAVKRIKEINSSVRAMGIEDFLKPDNGLKILKGIDLVVDCLDTVGARFLLQDFAKKQGIPMISGAIAGTAGQVMTIFPEDAGLTSIYGSQDEHIDQGVETETGNLSFCAFFIAAVQASEVVKVLLGKKDLLRERLFIADLMTNSFEIVSFV